MTITNISRNLFSKVFGVVGLISIAQPQLAFDKTLATLFSYEVSQRSSNTHRNTRNSFTHMIPQYQGPLTLSKPKEGLALYPILWVTSFFLAFDSDLRIKFQNSYSGKIPYFTSFLLKSARTGALGETGDTVQRLQISESYTSWVNDNKLNCTIFDIDYLKQGDNYLQILDFYTKISTSSYVSCVGINRHYLINSGKTQTLSATSVFNGKIYAHYGSSFSNNLVSDEYALIAILSGLSLVKSDGTKYTFSDSQPCIASNMDVGVYPSHILTLFDAFVDSQESTIASSVVSDASSSTSSVADKRKFPVKSGLKQIKTKRGPKTPQAGGSVTFNLPTDFVLSSNFAEVVKSLFKVSG